MPPTWLSVAGVPSPYPRDARSCKGTRGSSGRLISVAKLGRAASRPEGSEWRDRPQDRSHVGPSGSARHSGVLDMQTRRWGRFAPFLAVTALLLSTLAPMTAFAASVAPYEGN